MILSMLGMIFGISALIICDSLIEGFERSLREELRYATHSILTTEKNVLDSSKYPKELFKDLNGISKIFQTVESYAIIQSRGELNFINMIGVDSIELNLILENQKKLSDLNPGKYSIILGRRLADQLKVRLYDQIRLTIPNIIHHTIIGGIPSQRMFTIIDIFNTSTEVDESVVFVHRDDAKKMMYYQKDEITGWRVHLKDPLCFYSIAQQNLPKGVVWKDYMKQKVDLFKSVETERKITSLLLNCLLIMSCFGLTSSVSYLIIKKREEISILRTLGAKSLHIVMIFMIQGLLTGFLEVFFGNMLGIFVSYHIKDLMEFLNLPYHINSSISFNCRYCLKISSISILFVMINSIYPSWYATTFFPTNVLRHER
ncbi:Lipoprotein releasing system transmembrane protein LolC [Candidatus Riesia pediculischaeffi PTSU]|nr:Lipoprotein releasing system transmembrane protein LolC [Candidatus Riesia pediculischaeffi PTSU]